MIAQAINTWGRLDTLVCNAGFLQDRMLAGMSESEWGSVIRVHPKGHFAPARHAMNHLRQQAKAGVALLTVQEAAESERYGVMVNAVAPDARTRMTAGVC